MQKPPKPNLSRMRATQRQALEGLSSRAKQVGQKTVKLLRDLDERAKLTEHARNLGTDVSRHAAKFDQQTGISHQARKVVRASAEKTRSIAAAVKMQADERGITEALGTLDERVLKPVKARATQAAQSAPVRAAVRDAQSGYGAMRGAVMDVVAPVLPTYDVEKLLGDIASELNYVAACLMQISPRDSAEISSRFGRALAAKLTGAGVAAGLTGLVAAFGTAGTGTAIASLSGAAATKATMAWVGGLVGGGAAAGATVTAGITLVVAAIAMSILSSTPRDFNQLTLQEQRVLQTCWLTAAICNEMKGRYRLLEAQEVVGLYEQALRPLDEELRDEVDALCKGLDGRNATALREHALPDLGAVLETFPSYLSWRYSEAGMEWAAQAGREARLESLALTTDEAHGAKPYRWSRPLTEGNLSYALGGAIAALISGQPLEQSAETDMLLEAVRRYASTALGHADVYQVRDYVQAHWDNPEWRRAFGSGVLGHFQEQLVLDQRSHAVKGAEPSLFDDPHHPGADIQYTDAETEEIVQQIQVKASASPNTVYEALRKHPDIPVVVNKDVADQIDDPRVSASEHTYDEIRQPRDEFLQALNEHTVLARVERSAATAVAVATLSELTQMVRGEREFPQAVLSAAGKTGTTAAATLVTAMLFG